MASETSPETFRRIHTKKNSKKNNKKAGIALGEVFVTILALAASVTAVDSFPQNSDPGVVSHGNRNQAVAIAHGQMTAMRGLPFNEIRTTPGFAPANWINEPGHPTGEVHVQIEDRTNATVLADETSHVSWNVRPRPNTSKSMMDVTLRVSWMSKNGASMDHFEIDGWRVR